MQSQVGFGSLTPHSSSVRISLQVREHLGEKQGQCPAKPNLLAEELLKAVSESCRDSNSLELLDSPVPCLKLLFHSLSLSPSFVPLLPSYILFFF